MTGHWTRTKALPSCGENNPHTGCAWPWSVRVLTIYSLVVFVARTTEVSEGSKPSLYRAGPSIERLPRILSMPSVFTHRAPSSCNPHADKPPTTTQATNSVPHEVRSASEQPDYHPIQGKQPRKHGLSDRRGRGRPEQYTRRAGTTQAWCQRRHGGTKHDLLVPEPRRLFPAFPGPLAWPLGPCSTAPPAWRSVPKKYASPGTVTGGHENDPARGRSIEGYLRAERVNKPYRAGRRNDPRVTAGGVISSHETYRKL